ncbi:hypothetical protein [Bradyrhizobium algeriense]|uniref:hypothetical protein n=1 Tax=Bradyrhizobium algeriense TaxID=634784 RepID=UPI000D3D9E6B|nr:hypothetical protein [Bradyrhizobium algeriense]
MTKDKGETTTLTIHHDRCDPSKWSLTQWQLLQDFIREPLLQRAAALSKLGIQLVLSETHVPAGGSLEEFGWADEREMPSPDRISDDLEDITQGDDITPVVQVYRGPTRYAVRFAIDDGHGEFGGYEYEIKESEAEAEEFLKSLHETEPA